MARRKRRYTVRTGDTASTIAKQLGVDPQTLMRANTGVSNLRPGMVLGVPRAGAMAQAYGGVQLGAMPVADPVPPGLEPYYPGGNYNPSDIMPATRPIPAYTQVAGHGTPTDYFGPPSPELPPHAQPHNQTVTVEYQLSKGYSDVQMSGVGFTKRGNFWMRPVASTTTATDETPIYEPAPVVRRPTRNVGRATKGQRRRYGTQVTTKEHAQWKKRKHAYRDAQDTAEEPGVEEFSAEDFKAWHDKVTGYYGEGIWNEAKFGAGSGITGRASIEYTAYAKGAFDRYSQLEQSDTKLGFYEWFQESQHIFGSAAWDDAMDKTVGGDYRTDKAKAAYQAYLGYEPDWEVEEAEFAGAASAPRYQQQYGGYSGGGGGSAPFVKRYARPNYLGLINWRI